jgi:hypothetical protein
VLRPALLLGLLPDPLGVSSGPFSAVIVICNPDLSAPDHEETSEKEKCNRSLSRLDFVKCSYQEGDACYYGQRD